jgi:NAD(P)-dependent dehydrogenase (short-subunit alcohol dehydrogenase family)
MSSDKAKAEAVAGGIALAGGTALAIAADAGTPAGIDAMIAGAAQAFGGLDILHNNAFGQPALPSGRSRLALIGDLDETVWTHTIELGLTGVFRATKGAIPELLKRGYARAGITEYWILNLAERVLEVHREPTAGLTAPYGWRYRLIHRLAAGDVVSPLAAPRSQISVARLTR